MGKRLDELTMYRVYGQRDGKYFHDDYIAAYNAQDAADRIRDEYKDMGGEYEVIEVAKVVRNWK